MVCFGAQVEGPIGMGVQSQAKDTTRIARLIVEHQPEGRFASKGLASLPTGGAKTAAFLIVELLDKHPVLHIECSTFDKALGMILCTGNCSTACAQQRCAQCREMKNTDSHQIHLWRQTQARCA